MSPSCNIRDTASSFLLHKLVPRMKLGLMTLAVAALPLCHVFAEDASSIEAMRATLGKWVEARETASKALSDWQTEKEMLEQTATLFEKDLANLDEQMAKTDTGTSQVEKEKAKLEAEKSELEAASEQVSETATKLEQRLKSLTKALPPPLVEKLQPLMKRVPQDPAHTRITPVERMQNLVGILNEVDKFNGAITVESELQKRPSNEEIQVKTLYVGLGQAYFVDKTGDFAGVGVPSLSGWEWKEQPELAGAIQRCIAIYENTEPPAFVGLPLTVN